MTNQNAQISVQQMQAESKRHISEGLRKTRMALRLDEITMSDLMECTNEVAVDAAQGTYMNPQAAVSRVIENNAPRTSRQQMRPVAFGDWNSIPVLREGRNGKETMVYKVKHNNGKLVEHSFRHEVVAKMVSALLNESNNVNDPRLSRIIDLCNKEDSVMLELRQNKKMFETTLDPKKKAALKNKFEENKLILAGVRSKLGVA